MCEVRIVHRQRMQSKFALDFLQEASAWFMQADPHKRTVLLQDTVNIIYVNVVHKCAMLIGEAMREHLRLWYRGQHLIGLAKGEQLPGPILSLGNDGVTANHAAYHRSDA
jgi:hypothetical protein